MHWLTRDRVTQRILMDCFFRRKKKWLLLA